MKCNPTENDAPAARLCGMKVYGSRVVRPACVKAHSYASAGATGSSEMPSTITGLELTFTTVSVTTPLLYGGTPSRPVNEYVDPSAMATAPMPRT